MMVKLDWFSITVFFVKKPQIQTFLEKKSNAICTAEASLSISITYKEGRIYKFAIQLNYFYDHKNPSKILKFVK